MLVFALALHAAVARGAETLSLEEALRAAEAHNRAVANAHLGVQSAEDRLGEARTYFLPQFKAYGIGGELLTSIDFTFSRGVFGTYAGIGPIPATDTSIRTPRRFAFAGMAQVAQPVTQLYKVGLNVSLAKLGVRASEEDVRARWQATRQQVKSVYFNLVQAQAAVSSAREGVGFADEVVRTSQEALAAKTILPGEAASLQARRALAQQQLLAAQGAEATLRERLNFLLGRDLATDFELQGETARTVAALDLAEARRRAIASRPELAQAKLAIEQADLKRRVARAGYIPDVSLTVSAVKFDRVEFMPDTVTSAGVMVQWDVFDWGRRSRQVASEARGVTQAKNTAADAEAQVMIEVGAAHRRLQQSEALLTAARLKQDAEREQLRVTMNLFGQKQVLLRDVLGQRTTYEAATMEYQQALAGVGTAAADLEKAMGEK